MRVINASPDGRQEMVRKITGFIDRVMVKTPRGKPSPRNFDTKFFVFLIEQVAKPFFIDVCKKAGVQLEPSTDESLFHSLIFHVIYTIQTNFTKTGTFDEARFHRALDQWDQKAIKQFEQIKQHQGGYQTPSDPGGPFDNINFNAPPESSFDNMNLNAQPEGPFDDIF